MTSLGSLGMYQRVPALQQLQFQAWEQQQQLQQQQALHAAAHMQASQFASLFAASQQQSGPNPAVAWSTCVQPNFMNLAVAGQTAPQLMMSPNFQQLAQHAANARAMINPNFLANMARPMPGHENSPPSSLSGHSTELASESSRTQSPSHASRVDAHKTSAASHSPSPSCPDSPTSVNTIFPRRKAGQQARLNSKPVVLNESTLTKMFSLPLYEAASKLGISATAMKSACRKLGIKKWPYRSVHSTKANTAPRRKSPPPTSAQDSQTPLASQSNVPKSVSPGPIPVAVPVKPEDLRSLSQDAALLANLFQQSSALNVALGAQAPNSSNSVAMLLN